jgi:hypothetical protein
MGGRSAGNVITRYAGIQVQTSSLGVNVPVGWGTFRCKCNLVDYLDFGSKAQKAAAKGGSTITGYSYSATLVLAICEGPIDSISQVWVDSKTESLASSGLTLATGAVGQSVWSYLTSSHPDHALGYSGLAIVYASNYPLDSGAGTPNHSFEVVRTASFGVGGTPDADPSLVVTDFFTNARYGVPSWGTGLLGSLTQYQNYCLAAGLLVSPVIDSQRSASDFLNELLKATNSTCVWSEGVLKFIAYGDTALTGNGKTYTPNVTPVYSLTDDHFVVEKDSPPILVDVMDQSDAYNVIQLEYLDRSNQYNMAIALASDAANVAQYGMRRKDPDTVHCICASAVAAISAQLFLQRTLYVRGQYKFTLAWPFALLEPGDIVQITDAGLGLSAYPVRIIQIDEDETGGLQVTAEDAPIGIAATPLYTMQAGVGYAVNQGVDPGGVEANLLLYSGDASNAAWAKVNATVTGASHTDQYGLTTAATIVPTAVNGEHTVYQTFTNTFAGLNYTYTACVQQGAHKLVEFRVMDAPHANGAYFEADVNAGIITVGPIVIGAATVTAASVSASLVAGIWVLSLTINIPSAAPEVVAISVLDASGNFVWTGDGSNAIYVSQQQLYQGLPGRPHAATAAEIAGPYLFNPPSVLAAGGQVWAAVAGGPNWGGAHVWVSTDGTNYQQIGTIDAPARYGYATASFASHADPDTTNTLAVDLGASGGELTAGSTSDADAGGTLCLIDDELICFTAATLTNPNRYSLGTSIRRGYLNSGVAAHSAGALFVRLDDAIFDFPYFATNAGQVVYVKFQSFNLWGLGIVDLSDCLVYSITPTQIGSAAPSSAAWTAVGTVLSNAGQSIPAIVITGASDNPSATAIDFDYRVTGTSIWASGGMGNPTTTRKEITSVQSGQTYDVSVLYLVNGVPTFREIIASAITVGTISGGSGGSGPGTTLLNDSVSGSGKTFVLPAGSYTHVDIVLTGIGGAGSGYVTGDVKDGWTYTDYGGSAAGAAVVLGFPASPGLTITYTLPGSTGSAATATATGLSISANSGVNAPSGGPGTPGGSATITTATGASATHAYTGHAGGLVDSWDGGGAADITGTYVDQTTDSQPGLSPGGGGAGGSFTSQPGAGACLQIIARA